MNIRTLFLLFLWSLFLHKVIAAQTDNNPPLPPNDNHGSTSDFTWSTVKIHDIIAAPGERLVQIDALNFLDENGQVAAISFHINIDTSLVTFLGITNTTLPGNWFANYNNQTHDITIIYSAAVGTGYNIDGKLLDLRLFYKGGFTALLDFKPNCEMTNKNLQTITNVDYLDGSITQSESVGTVTINDIQCLPNTNFVAPILIQGAGLNSVNYIHLRVSYDNSKVEFTGFTPGSIPNVTLQQLPDMLVINWSDPVNPINLTNLTTFIQLGFNFIGQGNTELNFEPGSNIQSGGVFLPITYDSGSILQLFSVNLISSPVSGGQVTGAGTFISGTPVSVSAIANENFIFSYWSNGSTVVSTTSVYEFIMPDQNVFLTAHFTASAYLLTLLANPENAGTVIGGGYFPPGQIVQVEAIANQNFTFLNWTLNNAVVSTTPVFNFTMPIGNALLIANFVITTYPLLLEVSPQNAGVVTGEGQYAAGQTISIHASPNQGFSFLNWTQNGTIISLQADFVFVMPGNPTTLVSNFVQTSFVLELISNPEGAGILSGGGFYEPLTAVVVSASVNDGFAFVNWTNNGNIVSILPSFNFIMPASNVLLTANFVHIGYELSLIESPAGAGVLSGDGYYIEGQIATVSADDASGFDFINWTENGTIISTSATFNYTMPGHSSTLMANFFQTGHILSMETYPSDAGAISGSGIYDEGEIVQVTANANPAYQFATWTLNGNIISYYPNFEYVMPAYDVNLIAQFNYTGYELTLIEVPEGAGQSTGSGFYDAEEQISVNTASNPGYFFINWMHDGDIISNQPNFTYTMPASNTMLIANFVPIEFDLTLTAAPENGGTMEGAGFYYVGDLVIIIAYPSIGYVFDYWTLNGDIFAETASFSFEMPLNDLALVANFSVQQLEIVAIPNNSDYGTTTGSGTYDYASTVTVAAISNPGYYFVLWTENDEAVSYDEIYNFTVTTDRILTAHFQHSGDCPEPVALGELNIDDTKAEVIWYPSDNHNEWDLIWGIHGFDTISGGNLVSSLTTNTYILEGLQRNTAYDFYVRTVCGSDTQSGWAGPETFTTLLVGVDDSPESSSMKIYPNPAHEKVIIKFNALNNNNNNIRISLFDLSGKAVYIQEIFNENEIEIPIQTLEKGIYIIRATNSKQSFIQKLVIY